MMYTTAAAATVAAVDYQFRKYTARRHATGLRLPQRIVDILAPDTRSREIVHMTQNSGAGGEEDTASGDSESSGQKSNAKVNPPRAGPVCNNRTVNIKRRRCLWKKSIESQTGCSAS